MLFCLKSLFTQVHKKKYTKVLACAMTRWRLWPAETETLLVWMLCSGVKVTVDRSKTLKRLSDYLTLGVQSVGFVRISCGPTCAGECLSVRPDQEHLHELCFRRCQSQREVCIQNLNCDLDLVYLIHHVISMCHISSPVHHFWNATLYVCVP